MKKTVQRVSIVVAGLLLAGLAGCSAGGKEDDPFKAPPSSDVPLPPARTSFKLRAKLNGYSPWQHVAISPDGKLAAISGDKSLHILSIPEGKEVRSIPVVPVEADCGRTSRVLFFPDGKTVATLIAGNPDLKTPRLFQIETGQEAPHRIPLKACDGMALSRDGSLLAVTAGTLVKVWDFRQGKKLREFDCSERFVSTCYAVAFSSDSALLAGAFWFTSGWEGPRAYLLRVWDLRTGKEVLRGWDKDRHATSVAFSPDGRLLAVGGHGTEAGPNIPSVEIWDLASKKMLHTLAAANGVVQCLAFHPSGSILATAGDERTIVFWDANKGTVIGKKLEGHPVGIQDLAFSKDGRIMVSTSYKHVLIWEAD